MSYMSGFFFLDTTVFKKIRSFSPKFSICVRYQSILLAGKTKFKQSLSSSSYGFSLMLVVLCLKICGGVLLASREDNCSEVRQTVPNMENYFVFLYDIKLSARKSNDF